MKKILLVLLLSVSSLFAEYSIVFVHVGNRIPKYSNFSITQARLFNPKAKIIFLCSKEASKSLKSLEEEVGLEICYYEDIALTPIHVEYQKQCSETSQFWRFTSERFLYLWDLISERSMENVFHLENDNMLYVDLEQMLPIFQKKYPGVGATFDNEDRCIPGFVWISNKQAMEPLAEHFVSQASKRTFDMFTIGSYRKLRSNQWIERLPIIMPEYNTEISLKSTSGHITKTPEEYSKYCEEFKAIFDAAAIGQFLGGIDPIHAKNQPGFINESCLFNPSFLVYNWIEDEQKRWVPFVEFNGKSYQIVNLHIHSKRLNEFKSFY